MGAFNIRLMIEEKVRESFDVNFIKALEGNKSARIRASKMAREISKDWLKLCKKIIEESKSGSYDKE